MTMPTPLAASTRLIGAPAPAGRGVRGGTDIYSPHPGSTVADIAAVKRGIRERVWRILEERGVARFPKPIRGRIPNFVGAERAAARLVAHRVFQDAEVVFCCPDSPQRPVREAALLAGKTLVMATPRLRRGFIILEGVPRRLARAASTIRGAFRYGRLVEVPPRPIDLKVTGSVAVTVRGDRLGKGGGYSDLEYAILRELGLVDEDTPVATTVHELQVVDYIPMTRHDVPVDLIFTPSRVVEVEPRRPKPPGLILEELEPRKLSEVPLLRKLLGGRLS